MNGRVTIVGLIPPNALVVPMRAGDSTAALRELASALGRAHDLDPDVVHRALLDREQVASTALGDGVALPHGRGDVLETVGALGVAPHGIDWQAEDGMPVRLCIALVSPRDGTDHLIALRCVGGLLADASVRARLLTAENAAGVAAVLASVSSDDR